MCLVCKGYLSVSSKREMYSLEWISIWCDLRVSLVHTWMEGKEAFLRSSTYLCTCSTCEWHIYVSRLAVTCQRVFVEMISTSRGVKNVL